MTMVVNYGGGLNSTAILLRFIELDCRPDIVIFSDTGGEKPETYAFIEKFSKHLEGAGFPEITIVRYEKETLEENCHRIGSLPSLAYGFKKCSHKFKIQPVTKFLNNHEGCKKVWKEGRQVIRVIGFDAGEAHRLKAFDDKKFHYIYPLVDWQWRRKECAEYVQKLGFSVPKSSCFFCPGMKKGEILQLNKTHPELMKRALEIEENAEENNTSVKGLGRSFSWKELIEADEKQVKLFDDTFNEIGCFCYDGEGSE